MPGNIDHDGDPTISVVSCTILRYHTLKGVLDDVACQMLRPLEVIVIDQTPESHRDPAFYDEYKSKMNLRVEWAEARGLAAARNLGLTLASGDIVVFVDDDIRFGPDFLEAHMGAYKSRLADAVTGLVTYNVGPPARVCVPASLTPLDTWEMGSGR